MSAPDCPAWVRRTHASEWLANSPKPGGNVRVLGESLFQNMLLPFEVASLILLVAMVGAIVLAKKEDSMIAIREWDVEAEPNRELVEQEV